MSNPTNEVTEDYLDEDKPFNKNVKKQNYCVISMLTPNSFPENKREQYKDQKILGIKIRGVFEEYTDATERASSLQKIDKYHNIFVGEIGKWLPFDVDTTNMGTEDQVYREKSLNKYMKSYKESLQEEEKDESSRKSEMLKGANIVTGKHGAPASTGLSVLDDVETPQESSGSSGSASYAGSAAASSSSSSVDESKDEVELKNVQEQSTKLKEELADSKVNLQTLEEKLSTISQIYSDLKSK
jgi:hypothetical protein